MILVSRLLVFVSVSIDINKNMYLYSFRKKKKNGFDASLLKNRSYYYLSTRGKKEISPSQGMFSPGSVSSLTSGGTPVCFP